MLGPLGEGLVVLSLLVAAFGAVTGFAAGLRQSHPLLRMSQFAARLYAVAMIGAVAVMEYALVTHDFSVKYVAKVGSLSSPPHISVVSLWSSLEGSILLWGLVLALFVVTFSEWSRDRHPETTPYSLATMLTIAAFFAFLIVGPANPFTPAPSPVPTDGPGPNPLLQNHILMVVHPPMLYLGYVGMTVPFGMAVGALMAGQLGPAWTIALRRALLVPWGFLTVGIVLGGWWAYEVLGWGGYWAWDPVENASFLPWLTATAALHSAMLPSRRDSLKGWTVTLVLATFLLTLLGTFMTRSGVFNSVHSFTQSPIGPIFLLFLGVALVLCVVLLAARIDALAGEGAPPAPVSRESSFLLNNLLFVALTFTVLLGTTFPLIMESVKGVRLSVGEPYFNQVAVPAGVALLFLMGVGPALPWGQPSAQRVISTLTAPTAGAFAALALQVAIGGMPSYWTAACVFAGGFAMTVTVREMVIPVRTRMREQGEPLAVALSSAWNRGRRRYGGYIVHAGVIVIIVAIALSNTYRIDREVRLNAGETVSFEEYQVTFLQIEEVQEPHRLRTIAALRVTGGGLDLELRPALNNYKNGMDAIGSPDVHPRLTHDVYASLMSVGRDNQSVGLHLFRNPGIVWLWIGTAICALGTLIAAWPARRLAQAAATVPDGVRAA